MTHFRISVSLNSFFNDQRSLSYILIDNRFQTIEDLEDHIKQVFKLNTDTDICLLSNNHLLPSSEGIHILNKDDSIQVTPVSKNFFVQTKQKTRNVDEIEFHSKKKKLSKRKDDSHIALDLSSDERDYYKLEQEHSSKSKRKRKRSTQNEDMSVEVQIDNFQNVIQKTETEDVALIQSSQENHINKDHNNFENKTVQILNVETISQVEFNCNEHKNIETSQIELNNVQKLDDNDQVKNIIVSSNETVEIEKNQQSKNQIVKDNSLYNNQTLNTCPNNVVVNNEFDRKVVSKQRKKLPLYTVSDFLIYAQQLHEKADIPKSPVSDKNDPDDHTKDNMNVQRENDPPQSVSTFITKRRRRVRKRKSRHGNDNVNDSSSFIQSKEFEAENTKSLKTTAKPSIHIRFPDEQTSDTSGFNNDNSKTLNESNLACQENLVSILKNDKTCDITNSAAIMTASTPKAEHAPISSSSSAKQILLNNDISTDYESTFINTSGENDSVLCPVNIIDRLKKMDLIQNLNEFKCVALNKEMPPNVNDIVAFKLYEMNEMYEPQISDWVIGRILKWYPTTKSIDLIILAGRIQTNIPQGKFGLEDEDDTGTIKQHTDIVHLDYMSLIEAKILLIE